jgi:hypothetical protein
VVRRIALQRDAVAIPVSESISDDPTPWRRSSVEMAICGRRNNPFLLIIMLQNPARCPLNVAIKTRWALMYRL